MHSFVREKWLRLKLFYLKRSVPRCYLFSSKFMLTASLLLAVYILFMDIKLIGRVKNRAPLKPFAANNSPHARFLAATSTKTSAQSAAAGPIGVFSPLPVKKIMMAEGTHFIRSPLAELVERSLGFTSLFPFIGPNVISFTHCALSIVCIRFLISDALSWRQVGVCVFQFRNFLDSFDGVVYRAHANRHAYKSHYGSIGYYVDAFSDVFGGTCLIGSIAIYLLKHRPLNKSLTRCFRLSADEMDDVISSASSGSSEKGPLILPTHSASAAAAAAHGLDPHDAKIYSNSHYYVSSGKMRDASGAVIASKAAILASVAFLGVRFALSALFWDRSVHAYEDLLDCQATSEIHQVITYFAQFL
jgi:hypothetical protein